MGRRKIAIEPLTDDRNRTVTFTKRKAGLFKKAHELAVLCDIDISVIIIGRNHKVYEYSSDDLSNIVDKFYESSEIVHETKRPHDYGNFETKSRILDQQFVKNSIHHNNHSHIRNNSRSSHSSQRSLSHDVTNRTEIHPVRSSRRNANRITNNKNVEIDQDDDNDDDDNNDEDDDDEEEDDNNEDNIGEGHDVTLVADESRQSGRLDSAENVVQNDTDNTYEENNDTSINQRMTRKRAQQSVALTRNMRSRSNQIDDTIDSPQVIAATPQTPEAHFQNQPNLTENTPYRAPPSSLKNLKGKDSKRPTLSLRIPSMDNDPNKSTGSTITASNSSNKSQSGNVEGKANKDKKEIRIDDRKDIIIPSPVYNVTDSSSANSSHIRMPMMENSTPIPSALFKDRKIYTPLSTTFMNNLSMLSSAGGGVPSANADLAQMGYFNFNGMSPTQVLTPVFPFTQSNSNNNVHLNSANNNKQTGSTNTNTNQNQNQQNVESTPRGSEILRRGKLLQQLQGQPYKPGPNGLTIQTSQGGLLSPKFQQMTSAYPNIPQPQQLQQQHQQLQQLQQQHFQQQQQQQLQHQQPQTPHQSQTQTNSQTHNQSQSQQQLSQPFLPPMNSATSMYFPQMRMSNNHTNGRPSLPGANSNLSGMEIPTLTSLNSGNNNGHLLPHNGSNNGEISGLPSRYVEFQSPTTMFSAQDWSLPTATTPVLSQPNVSHMNSFTTSKSRDTGDNGDVDDDDVEDDDEDNNNEVDDTSPGKK